MPQRPKNNHDISSLNKKLKADLKDTVSFCSIHVCTCNSPLLTLPEPSIFDEFKNTFQNPTTFEKLCSTSYTLHLGKTSDVSLQFGYEFDFNL